MTGDVLSIAPKEPVPRPTLPKDWKYEKADKDFDKSIKAWRRLTVEILVEAFYFYLVLAKEGRPKKTVPDGTVSWDEWCKTKSIGRNTLWRHFIKLGWLMKEENETPEFPTGKYRVLYADPPWHYGNDQHGHEEQETVLETHYPTMSDSDLLALAIGGLAEENAVLFCWATAPRLPFALEVMKAWSFDYKAQFVWDKVRHNVGYYNSVRHELLLIGTRGSCLPDSHELIDSVVSIERTEHSKKPDRFREIIMEMYPNGKRIELFARKPTQGWDVWGNEA